MATNTQNRSQNRQANQPNSPQQPQRRSSKTANSGPGRGWHGDSEGHARAGSQSHKNK